MVSRPFIRNGLARAMYDKIMFDNEQRNSDHSHWYEVNKSMIPAEVCDRFIQFNEDSDTEKFLENCYEKSDWIFTQFFHLIVKSILGFFLTKTSINGFLGRGSMFVYSSAQFLEFLSVSENFHAEALLDIGAGDGKITEKMDQFFDRVFVTEISQPMISRLESKRYTVLNAYDWFDEEKKYDVITCLNVLDRCDKPATLLSQLKQSLKPNGRLIIALVLPFKPFVEAGFGHRPSEFLRLEGKTFEDQLTFLSQVFFPNMGFKVHAVSKVPYLCEGGLDTSFYVIEDALFLLSAI
ncbi:DgyrCDS10402 [Dimorphilus gyrociliatus]|uniref:DgyrCDS10402 n=1 Tax=Dimorphilus gyrociliatus TaxID=2664684 RepID=A0A7I8W049_9ANNE|nr:DgyrCDS10402 [Dimorphilus gyrociliatus]